jgi:hypothetical protein
MSRTVTPPMTQPTTSPRVQIPRDRIAQRAYEKWMKRGCPHGTDVQDWIEAERELVAEMARSSTPTGGRR